MGRQLLVTGGTGYVGSHTVVELQAAGYEVVIIDDLSNSTVEVVDQIEKISGVRPSFEEFNLQDLGKLEAFFRKYPRIEAIVHFVAYKAVGESIEKPLLYNCNLSFPKCYNNVVPFAMYRLKSDACNRFYD